MTKRHIAPALLLLSLLGCSLVKPTKISPITREAALPAPAASEDVFVLARKYVVTVARKLPLWERDYLGQFERPQIADVRDDLARCYSDTDPDAFLSDVKTLMQDQERLIALDQMLKTNGVI